jgi:hypothetical protein
MGMKTKEKKQVKHSAWVCRNDDDTYDIKIFGTNSRHEVSLLIRALEKEVSNRSKRAIPLSESTQVSAN